MAGEIIYSVFVSSTYEDLREERAAVQKALLQLKCMPIGMELFGSADEETWEFIQRQIADCDYYVVIVAGKYGSIADDGLSFTEKEYDYAREIKKPVLGFIHGNRGGIASDKTEVDPEKRAKLATFIEKVRKSPVSFFTATDDLTTKVLASFVNFRDRRPAVGFIRADQAPDLKKYADLLEENARLRTQIAELKSAAASLMPFPSALDKLSFTVDVREVNIQQGKNQAINNIKMCMEWKDLFVTAAEYLLTNPGLYYADAIRDKIVGIQKALRADAHEVVIRNKEHVFNHVLLRLIGWGLLERTIGGELHLTEYGQKQYGLLMD